MAQSQLPCGASYDDLLDQVVDHRPAADPAHQHSCPYCRVTLAELHSLWAPVHELAKEDVRAPAALLRTVMARVRQLIEHPWYAVLSTERGNTRIGARVVAAVARLAAEEVPSVTLAMGGGRTAQRFTPSQIAGAAGEAATEVGVAGSHVIVDIDVVVELGAHIPTVAGQLRSHIGQGITDHLGLTTIEVNVTVVDVQPSTTRVKPAGE